jgi:sulfatase modifying factor 1
MLKGFHCDSHIGLPKIKFFQKLKFSSQLFMRFAFFWLLLPFIFTAGCSDEAQKRVVKPAEGFNVEIIEEDGMVLIPGQTYRRGNKFSPGNKKIYREESPPHMVTVSSFWIDKYEVTNAQFKEFVDQTGYVTFAEKRLSKEVFPNAPPEQLVPGATIFSPPSNDIDPWASNDAWRWWSYVPGANWQSPEGKGSTIKSRMNHPVVCLNPDDAKAYAKWAGKRLPTEAEWELAARGGLKNAMFTWGDEPKPDEKWMANCFQGRFPANNSGQDGFIGTAPVGSYPPNGYGLYDMAGNVWEICSDFYHPDYYSFFTKMPHPDPNGPEKPITNDELQHFNRYGTCPLPRDGVSELTYLHVTKGGSFLCHWDYCLRYRPAARHYAEVLAPTNHSGFRCVRDSE